MQASLMNVQTKISPEGQSYNQYNLKILRTTNPPKEWRCTIVVAELVSYLQWFVESYAYQTTSSMVPQELIQEIEGTNKSKNGASLINFLNQTVFQDPNCMCSLGMREYFVTTFDEKHKSYQGIRDSSEVMRRYQETAAGHLSHNDDLSWKGPNSQMDTHRPATLHSADILDF